MESDRLHGFDPLKSYGTIRSYLQHLTYCHIKLVPYLIITHIYANIRTTPRSGAPDQTPHKPLFKQ